jgi:hypothetical protein
MKKKTNMGVITTLFDETFYLFFNVAVAKSGEGCEYFAFIAWKV